MKPPRWKRISAMAAGVTVSAVFLWLSLRHVDIDGLRKALYAIKIWWLAGCTVCLGAGIVLRSIRWRMILGRPGTEQKAFFRATTLGLFCGKFLGLILLIPVVDYIAISFLLQTFQLSLPFAAPLVLWVFLAAGSALPSAPGYVGVYQLAAVWALSFYNVSGSTAVMAATVFQLNVLAVAILCLAGRTVVTD